MNKYLAYGLLISIIGLGVTAYVLTLPHSIKPGVENVSASTTSKIPVFYAGCQIYSVDNSLNTEVSKYPLDSKSATYIRAMNHNPTNRNLRLSFNLPINVVDAKQRKVPVSFQYKTESDKGPYPIPQNVKFHPTPDRHISIIDKDNCMLYELYNARLTNGTWKAGAGAVFNLSSNKLRPNYWTSADAAGLPIMPLVVRYEEVRSGSVNHAIRVTAGKTQLAFINPATHASGFKDPTLPPMGLRLRLKQSYDVNKFPYQAKVIAIAMKRYGLVVADNGTSWVIGGEMHPKWNYNELNVLKTIPGSAFEVVNTGDLIKNW